MEEAAGGVKAERGERGSLASERKGRDADRSERGFSAPRLTTQETAVSVVRHQAAENS